LPKHILTETELAEGRKYGGTARAAALSPTRRKQISDIANAIKLAKANGWDPYTRNPSELQAIDERMYKLIAIEAKAWSEGDDWKVMRAIMNQLQFIRLRTWITMTAGKKDGASLDLTPEDNEASRRLQEARARRNRALGIEEPETIVSELPDATTETTES
jgi:hypothetical protein